MTATGEAQAFERGWRAAIATTTTWIKCAMNFVVPFIVSNLGLLSGRRSHATSEDRP